MKYPDLFNPDLSRVGTQESQMYNLIAGKLITEIVKTSLGPRGMEKVYTDIIGEDTITKHGGAFLRKVDVDHPAAKSVIEAVNAVDTNVGDGTISAAVLIGSLLENAQELLKKGLPTPTIIRGYEIGLEYALEILDSIKVSASLNDNVMKQLVESCLEGKSVFDMLAERTSVIEMIVDAILYVADLDNHTVDVDNIKIEEKEGSSIDIQLVKGTVLDKTIDNDLMPRKIQNAKILLLNDHLENMRTKTESQIEIVSPNQMSQFLNQETQDILSIAKKIVESGANVVISRKGINDIAKEYFAKNGIISIRRAKYNDIWWLEKSTGAKTCKTVNDISPDELGFAKSVYEKRIGTDKMVFVEDCLNPKSVTLLLRSYSKRYLDELHRSVLNAIYVLRNFIQKPHLVYGGGSVEGVISQKIRKKASKIEGKEQIVVERFSDSLEEIPLTLARNVGMNLLDIKPRLRAKHAKFSNGKFKWYGIDSETRKISDISTIGVIETSVVKVQVIKTAVEATNMILNVDDVFVKDLIDNTHCHIDGTVHAHKDPGRNHNHWEQEGLEQRQMHHYY